MHKKLITFVSVFLLFAAVTSAQVNTSSPYSRYGVGLIENHSLGKTFAMGGISTGVRFPFEINISNPASYSAIPNQFFLFQVGTRVKRIDYQYLDQKETNYDFNLTSINAAMKLNKYWALSFGMNPFSSVGYEINSDDSVSTEDVTSVYSTNYKGQGGLTMLHLGNSFVYKGISIGINASYVFGHISKSLFSEINDEPFVSVVGDLEITKVKDFILRYGIQYSDSLLGKAKFTVGGFFENKTNLNSLTNKLTTRSITLFTGSMVKDTLINDTIDSGKIQTPVSFGAGFSVTTKKIIFGADFQMSRWENAYVFEEKKDYLTNSFMIAAGAEYTNNYLSKKYFDKINFMIGGRYAKSNLLLYDKNISEYAITFGAGFPTKMGARINLGFEIGQKGTTDNNLIKENFYTLNLNFNLSDRWFVRRKFF